MRDPILTAARAHGFAAAYFLAPLPLPLWREASQRSQTDCGMPWDIPSAFPEATTIILLAASYLPYPQEYGHILPYYLTEHHAYFQAKALAREIAAQGFYCEPVWLPARALALANNVGNVGPNGLLALGERGTRFALFTLATNAVSPLADHMAAPACPAGCDACIRACPTHAISAAGLEVSRCLRFHMDDAAHPPFVLEKLTSFLGCDLCQSVCPKNAHLAVHKPNEQVLSAFELRRLILGDAADARALVGRNITGGGKLTVEAIALAAKAGLFEAEIRRALASPFEAVREAAKWALETHF